MKFTAYILSECVSFMRAASRYLGTTIGIAATTIFIVIPLWIAAQYYPTFYSIFFVSAFICLIFMWVIVKLRNKIRSHRMRHVIGNGLFYIIVVSLFILGLFGVFADWWSDGWIARGIAICLIAISIMLVVYRRYNKLR